MYDKGTIIPGLILFLCLFTFPVWYNLAAGGTTSAPELEAAKGEQCIEDTSFMRTSHMKLLNQWRDEVVRNGNRDYVANDGTHYEMSLTKTCLGCHLNKANFCDRCHSYVSVEPYCWDCHVDPKEFGL